MTEQQNCTCVGEGGKNTVKLPLRGLNIPLCGTTVEVEAEGLFPEKEYAQSLGGQQGYSELPGGLILQWGWIQTGTNGMVDIVFTKPFPNRMLSIVATDNTGSGNFPYVAVPGFDYTEGFYTTKTKVRLLLSLNGQARQDAATWIAIGH